MTRTRRWKEDRWTVKTVKTSFPLTSSIVALFSIYRKKPSRSNYPDIMMFTEYVYFYFMNTGRSKPPAVCPWWSTRGRLWTTGSLWNRLWPSITTSEFIAPSSGSVVCKWFERCSRQTPTWQCRATAVSLFSTINCSVQCFRNYLFSTNIKAILPALYSVLIVARPS